MQVVVTSTSSLEQDRSVVIECVEAFRREGVVAVPTDTIYGLAASAESRVAIQKLYSIKGRNQEKPLAICVHNVESIERCVNVATIVPHAF